MKDMIPTENNMLIKTNLCSDLLHQLSIVQFTLKESKEPLTSLEVQVLLRCIYDINKALSQIKTKDWWEQP